MIDDAALADETPRPDETSEAVLHRALVAEVMRKTDISWVRWADDPTDHRDHAVWHVWHDDAMYLVAGRGEQPLPDAYSVDSMRRALVTARTKDSRARLVSWYADVSRVLPTAPEWPEVVDALRAGRLNLPSPETAGDRWTRDCVVLRLAPTGEVEEAPGRYGTDSGAAAPVPTAAVTRGRLPRVLHRRQARGPKLH